MPWLAALAALVIPAAAAGTPITAGTLSSPEVKLRLRDQRITEASGLAVSSRFSRVIYTHNDSGDSARFFAINRHGRTRATLSLKGASSRDWEDMAAGPRRTVWLGDIGDNGTSRKYISVFRVKEPRTMETRRLSWTQFDLRYPNGSHNAEALLVHPVSGALYVVTKEHRGAGIYRAKRPLDTAGYNVLRRVAGAPSVVTGGDFSSDGNRLVLRTYRKAYVYRNIGGSKRMVDLPSQKQGESVTFTKHKEPRLLVGSEGSNSRVWRLPAK